MSNFYKQQKEVNLSVDCLKDLLRYFSYFPNNFMEKYNFINTNYSGAVEAEILDYFVVGEVEKNGEYIKPNKEEMLQLRERINWYLADKLSRFVRREMHRQAKFEKGEWQKKENYN